MERECRDPTVRCFFIWFRSCCVIVFRFANLLHAHAYFCCAEYGYKFHSKNWQGSWSKGLSLLIILLATFFLQPCMLISWCCIQFTMCMKDLKIPPPDSGWAFFYILYVSTGNQKAGSESWGCTQKPAAEEGDVWASARLCRLKFLSAVTSNKTSKWQLNFFDVP